MITEFTITDWNSFVRAIRDIAVREHYQMWYRGQKDYAWGLIPSVQRPGYHRKRSEQYMATNFMIQTMRLKRDSPEQYDRSGWLDQLLISDPACDYLYKIRIPAHKKPDFLEELDILGIHNSTVYPDMEHIAGEQRSDFLEMP